MYWIPNHRMRKRESTTYATTTRSQRICAVLRGTIAKSNLRDQTSHNAAMATLRCVIMNLRWAKRRLTVREHCRLQSIPDYVVLAGSLERQFKSVNNCVPVGMAYAIGKTLIEAAGMVDRVSTESLNNVNDSETSDNVENGDPSWFIHDIFKHENLLNENSLPSSEHICECPDCQRLTNKNKGPGIYYEVYWGEHWVNMGYGRSSRNDTQHEPYWEPDLEILGKEVVYRYAARLHRESIGNASSSTGSAPRQMHPRQNVGRNV